MKHYIDSRTKPFLKIREIRSLTSLDDYHSTDHDVPIKRKTEYIEISESDEDFNIDNDDIDDDDDDDDDDSYSPDDEEFNSGSESNKKSEFRDQILLHCKQCSKSFQQPEGPQFRRRFCTTCKSVLQYQCARCADKIYTAMQSAQRHIQGECVNPQVMRCLFCDYKTPRKYRLIGHIERRHGKNRIAQIQLRNNDVVKNVVNNIKETRWQRKKKCPFCGNKFKTAVRYDKHVEKCLAQSVIKKE